MTFYEGLPRECWVLEADEHERHICNDAAALNHAQPIIPKPTVYGQATAVGVVKLRTVIDGDYSNTLRLPGCYLVPDAPVNIISVARLHAGGHYRFDAPRARVLSAEREIVGLTTLIDRHHVLDVLLDSYGHVDWRSHPLVRWLRRFSKRARPHAEQEAAAGDG